MKIYLVLDFYNRDKDTLFKEREHAEEYARNLYRIKGNKTLPKICEPEEIDISIADYFKMKLQDE